MNIQQVKGEVGDGEDDITTESLTKYEKACWDLGVALKEVKDGALQLRDPMLILKELSIAVSKEAEGSIKTANLINAVGGKYRGAQLAALLENWSTYEKMLAEFNSDEAIGSALEESMKTAESWEGRLNAVSNSWTELINKMIQSDDAISILNTVDSLIQDMSDSKTIRGLGSIADLFVKIFGAVGKVADWAGVIPTLSATFGMVSAFKGQSIFGNIIGFSKAESNYIGSVITALKDLSGVKATFKDFKIDLSGLGTPDIKSLQNYVNLIDSGEDYTVAFNKTMEDTTFVAREQAKNFEKLHIAKRKGVISTDEFTAATKNLATTQKVATATSKALSTALNLVANIGITLAISGLIKIISELIVTEQEAADKRAENIQKIQESVQKYQEEEQTISDLFDRYTELYNSTDDLSTVKQDLSQIQDELIDKFGKEAEAIDLLNGKYSENLKAQRELRKQVAEDFLSDNKKKIEQAEKRQNGKNTDSIKFKVTVLNNADLEKLHQLEKETNGLFSAGGKNGYDYTFKIKETDYNTQLKIIEQYAEIISQFDYTTEETYEKVINRKNDLDDLIAKDKSIIEEAKQARDLVDTNVSAEYDRAINELKEKQKQLSDLKNNDGSLFDIQTAEQELIDIQNTALKYAGASSVLKQEVFDIINSVDYTTKDLSSSFDALKSDIKEIVGEDFENSLSQIDKIKASMQTLASGELLEWSDASELMFDIDTERILGDFEEIDGKYRLIGNDIGSLIKLKDQLIQKQIDEIEIQKQSQEKLLKDTQIRLETAKLQLSRSNSASDAKYWNEQISDTESQMVQINSLTRDYNYLIGYLNSQLGDTVDYATALKERMEKVQESADKYADAMTKQVDDIIDNLQDEQDILEEQKSALEEQLDVLEEQKSELEDIIDKHKDIVDVIGEEIEREKKLLEEQRDAEEEAIQAKIDALKESKEKQEEENDLVEKELELQKKLADLEKAKQTKVRTFSQARGWHYDVDKEAVANAQTAVTDAQKTYDDAVAEKVFSDQIEALEKQKETIGETYEEQLKAYENYYEEWKAILDEEINAENERIAVEIMGSDWREKIKKRDSNILSSFAGSFRSYNGQLKNLVNTEIASLKQSISAKEEEIKAKQKQIKTWQDYKNQVEKSIESVKNKYDEYVKYLEGITLSENSSYTDREQALKSFVENYSGFIDEIQGLQRELADKSVTLSLNANTSEARRELAFFFKDYKNGLVKIADLMKLDPSLRQQGLELYARLQTGGDIDEELDKLEFGGSHANGGVVDYTGFAMLHGEKQRAETIFNAQQSRQLYDMVKTGNFSKLVAQKAIEGLKGAKMSNLTTNNSNDKIINIQNMTIKADNPTQFHDQFMKEIGQYWRVQLAESKVK